MTCHHCEDAPCARSCPNGAISHVDDSIQVNQQKCIGCKSCVVACPFGTMQIVLTPVAAGKVKATAHKCDLCAGRENGPACVENCPADALQLVTDVHSPAWRNPAACAPRVRNINRGMPVPRRKKCR
ncbi:(4Fe-4S)-binding protein [Escherichia coli]|nr:(4Fe-4S)-binding protein [Escherichia coli]